MGKIKGYIEFEDKRVDFDDSNAVAFAVTDGETVTGGIVGKLTGIAEHVPMAHMISKISDEITNKTKSVLEGITETEETQ